MADRRNSIGASSVAALFDCSPWQSAYGLWLEKTGLVEEQADTERLRAGRYLERAILEEWAKRNVRAGSLPCDPRTIEHNTHSFTSEQHAFITATPDALGTLGDGTPFVADVKTVEPMRRGDWEDGVPEYYLWQLRQQMYVTGTNKALLIAQFGFHEAPRHEWLELDIDKQDELVRRCCEFWKRVQGELPPPAADGSDATTNALKRRKVEAKVIELSPEVRQWTEELHKAELAAKFYKGDVQQAKNKIRAWMGDANVGVFPDGSGYRIITVNKREYTVKASSHTELKRIKAKDGVDEWNGEDE